MSVVHLSKPQRWDSPFDADMSDDDVATLLRHEMVAAIDAGGFPDNTPLEGILKNDSKIGRYRAGDIVVREGDYGNSAFLILDGDLRVFTGSYPRSVLGHGTQATMGRFEALKQVWTNTKIPELRDTRRYGVQTLRAAQDRDSRNRKRRTENRMFIQDIPAILEECRTVVRSKGELFGELAALGRIPRTTTIFSETDSTLLEIRWQGLREIRRFDEGFRRMVDTNYRDNALMAHLHQTDLFSALDKASLDKVAEATLFETYGAFDWHASYQKMRSSGQTGAEHEPGIARQGEYADGLLMIRAGFARVTRRYGTSQRTLTYLHAGGIFGLEELYAGWKAGQSVNLRASLTALGYVDVLRVPARILEELVFPSLSNPPDEDVEFSERTPAEDALLEWAVEERFINATKAMLIDLNRCVRCDDCVRACASTHGGNPRFIRHGKTYDHWMVANACMHCTDPVCMIGCPGGAIFRSQIGGTVVIIDDTCLGCSICASSCPYNNIRMVEIRGSNGAALIDPDSGRPIVKATKCDLCISNPGGPACIRACSHDALRRVDFRPESLKEGAM